LVAFVLLQPLDYQQTLLKSFTLGGIGLHSAEYGESSANPAKCYLLSPASAGAICKDLQTAHSITGKAEAGAKQWQLRLQKRQ
jgi:hypothetical protein